MSQQVKYPNQPNAVYRASVADETLIEKSSEPNNGCAKCFMGVMSLIMIILGVAMTAMASYIFYVLSFGGQNVIGGDMLTSASVYTLLVIGLVLIVVSIIVWVSSCNPINACSKIILTLFAIVMLVIFLAEIIVVTLAALWVENVPVNISGVTPGTIMGPAMNETIGDLFSLCCLNATTFSQQACDEILGDDTNTHSECSSFAGFYQIVIQKLSDMITYVAIFFGIVAFFNLVSFICSCCLLCSRKRSAYYKPTTYSNGGV